MHNPCKYRACTNILLTGLLWCIASCTGPGTTTQQLKLGADGTTEYQLILPAGANEPLAAAAELIQDAFAANGMELPVVPEDRDDPVRPGIYLGDTEYARSKGIDPEQFEEWGYLLRVYGKDLVITGTNKGHRMGVVKGACDFLREHAGTRFLYPGKTGIEFLPMPVISIPENLHRNRKPWVQFNDAPDHYPEEWLYNIASNQFPPGYEHKGHMWEKAVPYERYYHTHPEYFALVDGKRYHKERYEQYCISNPAVLELIVQFMIQQSDQGNEIIVLAQPDSFTPCQCENCRAFYGTGDDWDEKVWLFHREIAEKLYQARPHPRVLMLSYQATTHPPKSFKKFPENTMIYLSHTYDEALEEWNSSGVEVPGGFVAGLRYGSHFFTNYLPKRTPAWWEDQVRRMYGMNNMVALKRQGAADCYGLEGPAYYVWGRMFDDPSANDHKMLLEEFYGAAFGEAALPMRAFYAAMHERLELFTDWLSPRSATHFRVGIDGPKPGSVDDPFDWVRVSTANFGSRGMHRGISDPAQVLSLVFTPDLVVEMEQALTRAESVNGPEKVTRRLELVRMEFDYLKQVAVVNDLYQAWKVRPGQESLDRLLGGIDAFHLLLDSYYDENGRMKSLPGWPEIRPFRNTPRPALGLVTARWWTNKQQEENPFAWDTEAIRNNPSFAAGSR